MYGCRDVIAALGGSMFGGIGAGSRGITLVASSNGSMESVGRKTLLVRHLPSELTPEEQRQLLEKSGAESVRLCSGRTRGILKNVAFASYPNEYAAAKALSILHQLKVLGHTLIAEYAKEDCIHLPDQPAYSEKRKSGEKTDESKDSKLPDQVTIERGIAPNHGLVFPIRSSLKYLYPPPTSTILINIANALASVPKFYVQVLHLMNKMNLPAPFGLLTAPPPLYEDHLVPSPYPPVPPDFPENPPLPELDDDYDMEVSSREESEYESGDEEEKERAARLKELAGLLPERPRIKKPSRPRKKMKIISLLSALAVQPSHPHAPMLPSEVFEQRRVIGSKRMEIHIPADITTATDNTEVEPEGNGEVFGFGKIYPTTEPKDEEENEEDDDDLLKEFISRRELEKGRLSKEEMRKLSVFKNYEPGEPNCRLYVKNLSKQVTEKDLKFIFGKFIDFSSNTETNMFDIRLMTEGRMKGQAFIGFPNEDVAAKALKHTHGYELFNKPMVIQFARSARPKPNAVKTRTKR
ncbi:RNA-binding region-containing protein 3 [Phyllobates terribilis]|uniref:RNA-binding region-containing protein 3 n=1 Tax=Phyllobates terribilis TaxID=111132 RepID=UPI003CCA8EDF